VSSKSKGKKCSFFRIGGWETKGPRRKMLLATHGAKAGKEEIPITDY
jgi:hypothetical protein